MYGGFIQFVGRAVDLCAEYAFTNSASRHTHQRSCYGNAYGAAAFANASACNLYSYGNTSSAQHDANSPVTHDCDSTWPANSYPDTRTAHEHTTPNGYTQCFGGLDNNWS